MLEEKSLRTGTTVSKDGHLAIDMAKAQIDFYLVAPIKTRKEIPNGVQNSNACEGKAAILAGIPGFISPNYYGPSSTHFTIY
jgi:hypothetical protein